MTKRSAGDAKPRVGLIGLARHPLNHRFAGEGIPTRDLRWEWEVVTFVDGDDHATVQGWASFRCTAIRQARKAFRRAVRRQRLEAEGPTTEFLDA